MITSNKRYTKLTPHGKNVLMAAPELFEAGLNAPEGWRAEGHLWTWVEAADLAPSQRFNDIDFVERPPT